MDRLEERAGLREAGTPRRPTPERTEKGHRQSDQLWNRFKGNTTEAAHVSLDSL